MITLKKQFINSSLIFGILALLGVFVIASISCKSPMSPGGEGEADIIVYNDYGESLDIYMDGNFQFSLGHKSYIEIDNVSLGTHELEAKRMDTEVIIASATIEVEEKVDYTWTIDDLPDINVTNMYGETLEIYMDGDYQFDLVDEENRWILDVPYGERFLKAERASDSEQVASVTINITENKDYSWIIELLKNLTSKF